MGSNLYRIALPGPTLAGLIALFAGTASATAQAQTEPVFPIFALQFSPDGKLLAAASNSMDPPGPIVLWNVGDWSVSRVHRPAAGCLDLDFSPDGARLAYASKTRVVGVLDLPTGAVVSEIDAHNGPVFSVAFTPDGESLVSAGADRVIKLWRLADGALVRSFEGHTDVVVGVAVSPEGGSLLSGGNDGEVRLWDLRTGKLAKIVEKGELIVRRVAYSRNGRYFLASRWDGKVRIRDATSGRLAALLPGGSDCAEMTADNRTVLTSGSGSTAYLFALDLQPATDELRERIARLIDKFLDDRYEVREAAAKEIAALGLVAEPQLREAMAHDDAEVRMRSRRLRAEALSPEPTAKLAGRSGDVEVVCFSPDGRLIATGCRDGDVKIWDASTYANVATLRSAPAAANSP